MAEVILETRKLCKHYAGLRANHDINLQIQRGEIHALIGPNGAGKSTAIAQLSGELQPTSGSIFFNGECIDAVPVFNRSRLGIARSYQVSSLFDEMSVLENLALAVQAHRGHSYRFWSPVRKDKTLNDAASDLAQRFGLADRQDLPVGALAHGEKRQLEVAMTLAGDPQLLLLDEPMAGIGPGGSKKLTELLDGLRGQYTILLVEHDMDAVFALADRVSVLVYGEILATGTVDEIRANEQVQLAYLGEGESC
jgi:branched-chain amino acid transport system ATP-binding protein